MLKEVNQMFLFLFFFVIKETFYFQLRIVLISLPYI